MGEYDLVGTLFVAPVAAVMAGGTGTGLAMALLAAMEPAVVVEAAVVEVAVLARASDKL